MHHADGRVCDDERGDMMTGARVPEAHSPYESGDKRGWKATERFFERNSVERRRRGAKRRRADRALAVKIWGSKRQPWALRSLLDAVTDLASREEALFRQIVMLL